MIKKISVILMLFFVGSALAKEPANQKFNPPFQKTVADQTTQSLITVPNWAYWMLYDGQSAHDPFHDDSGGFYPRGPVGVIFQDGFIWGGIVNQSHFGNPSEDSVRVGGATYVTGTVPGWVETDGTPTSPPQRVDANNPRVRIYRIRSDWETLSPDQAGVIRDAALINGVGISDVTPAMAQEVIDHYASDWAAWPSDLGAPVDENGDPGVADADQVLWFVANDLSAGATSNLYGSPPIGVELQVTAWGYNQPGATLGQMLFKRYRLINKSGFPINEMYLSQWSDPDVGNYTDDLAGCDVDRSLGFSYSGFLTDDQFQSVGLPPAAVGYDFFQGPRIFTGDVSDTAIWDLRKLPKYINLPMTSFSFFAAGSPISDPTLSDYEGTLQWFNMLRGNIPTDDLANPEPYVHGAGPNAGQPTKFPLDGDPFKLLGDIDAFGSNLPPGDRRIVLTSGPFTMAPGDTQEVVVAVIGGIVAQAGGTNRNAVEQMKLNSDFAQFLYNNLFEGIPRPPREPRVNVTPLEDKIALEWGSDTERVAETEAPDTVLGFNFEGYNVYQLPDRNATKAQARRIATFDKDNFITIIRARQFVAEFGDIVEVPIQQGTDTGIQRFFVVDQDFIKDRPLFAGNSYYFAVTAYNFNSDPTVPEPSLESSLEIIEVIPQPPAPGTRYGGDALATIPVVHAEGKSDGVIKPIVIDPARTNGHRYEVFFIEDTSETLWNIRDLDDNNKVIFAQNRRQVSDPDAANDEPIFHGIQVRVAGPPPGVKPSDMFDTDDQSQWGWDIPSGVRRFTWGGGANGFGFEGFRGAIGWASPHYIYGGGPQGVKAADLKNVLLVLATVDSSGNYDPNDPNVSYGYRYGRGFDDPPAKPEFAPYIVNPVGGYSYQDYTRSVPLAAYDIEDPDNPRRLALGHLENNVEGGMVDGKYWPPNFQEADNTALGGPREWLWIFDADYTGDTPNPALQVEAINNPLPVMYWATVARRGPVPFSPDGTGTDQFAIFPGKINTKDDLFSFVAPRVTQTVEAERADVEKINVFPNPYYAWNPEEPNRFTRFVTFNHLPTNQRLEVRIFNLAGEQVRKLTEQDKLADSQFMRWDLRNEAGLPVASGLYVCYVNMPDLGKTKTLKLFIVQGEEILEFF